VLLYQPGPLEGSSSTDEPGGPSFSYPVFRGLLGHAVRAPEAAAPAAATVIDPRLD